MELPGHLRQAIESTYVAYEGLSHPLRVVHVDGPDAGTLRITVEAAHNGTAHHVTAPFDQAAVEDERAVATRLAELMREALSRG